MSLSWNNAASPHALRDKMAERERDQLNRVQVLQTHALLPNSHLRCVPAAAFFLYLHANAFRYSLE